MQRLDFFAANPKAAAANVGIGWPAAKRIGRAAILLGWAVPKPCAEFRIGAPVFLVRLYLLKQFNVVQQLANTYWLGGVGYIDELRQFQDLDNLVRNPSQDQKLDGTASLGAAVSHQTRCP